MIDKNSLTPLHIQLYDFLLEQINSREYQPNEPIPSENALSQMFGISRTTVRNVILRLANEHYLYKVPGKGTFVSEQKIITNTTYQKGIQEQLESQGYDTSSLLLSLEIVTGATIAQKLNLSPKDKLIKIDRVTNVLDTPLSYHINYLPYARFKKVTEWELNNKILCDMLHDNYHVAPNSGKETLELTTATASEARILNIPVNSTILLTECITYNSENDPYMFSKVLFRGDRIKLHFDYETNSSR